MKAMLQCVLMIQRRAPKAYNPCAITMRRQTAAGTSGAMSFFTSPNRVAHPQLRYSAKPRQKIFSQYESRAIRYFVNSASRAVEKGVIVTKKRKARWIHERLRSERSR